MHYHSSTYSNSFPHSLGGYTSRDMVATALANALKENKGLKTLK